MGNVPEPDVILGKHAILDISGCSPEIIGNNALVQEILCNAAQIAKITIVGDLERHFEPNGYTAILLLEESHLSIHTWPEYNYVSVDLYSCNLNTDFEAVKNFLVEQMKAEKVTYTLIDRGFFKTRNIASLQVNTIA